jgi:hypothetical protein
MHDKIHYLSACSKGELGRICSALRLQKIMLEEIVKVTEFRVLKLA